MKSVTAGVVPLGHYALAPDRHHIGAIEKIGDAAETFRFALGAIRRAGSIKPHELGIVGRIDDGFDLELEWCVGRLRDGELVGRGDKIFCRQRFAVELQ